MSLRIFRDSAGIEWRVWDVYPQWTERRLAERRQKKGAPPDKERRTGSERRVHDNKERPRLMVTPGLEGGWLSFESAAGRRRLAPIPSGWEEMRDASLEGLLKQAVALPPRAQRLIE